MCFIRRRTNWECWILRIMVTELPNRHTCSSSGLQRSQPSSAHTLLFTELLLASSRTKPRARTPCSPSSVVPNTSTPRHHIHPQPLLALCHCCNPLICRAAESPGHSASSQLFTFQKLTSKIVFCFPGWGFVLWDSSDAWNKGLLDQKRKKGLCCHFHFCVARPAGILVVCLIFTVWDVFAVLKIDLVPCCFRTTEVLIDSQIHCLALSGIKLL